MGEMQLSLTEDERGFLVDFLTHTLRDVEVEEHRTRNQSYRQRITHEKEMISRVLEKLAEAGSHYHPPVGVAL